MTEEEMLLDVAKLGFLLAESIKKMGNIMMVIGVQNSEKYELIWITFIDVYKTIIFILFTVNSLKDSLLKQAFCLQ